MATHTLPDAPAVEGKHLVAIRRLQRALERERSAHNVLEAYEQEYRDFRTMQSANRVNVSEVRAREISEAVKAAITLWNDSLIPD